MDNFVKGSIDLNYHNNDNFDSTFNYKVDLFGQYNGKVDKFISSVLYEQEDEKEEKEKEEEEVHNEKISEVNEQEKQDVRKNKNEIKIVESITFIESNNVENKIPEEDAYLEDSHNDFHPEPIDLPNWKNIITNAITALKNSQPISVGELITADTCMKQYFSIENVNRCTMKFAAYREALKIFPHLQYSKRYRQSFPNPQFAIELLRQILNYFFSLEWSELHIHQLQTIYEIMDIPSNCLCLSTIVEIYALFVSGDEILDNPNIDLMAVEAFLSSFHRSTLKRASGTGTSMGTSPVKPRNKKRKIRSTSHDT